MNLHGYGAHSGRSLQVRFDGQKTFIFHPLFASENFAEDKVGRAKQVCGRTRVYACFLV